ncbi:tRNA (Guanine37-N(1)-) methyltransferase [Magnetococcus marinus MC-1]|uniref:tRNA (guanine-N(1)-)-methyltransferase n=1 Tax=Magnetococcus marinus (strain ATCC BAA-1437 / JCM 17883 / MC-1) TaxID=156889 RepID=TRMD_MAGMM|nr:tRNA (guanosine(37)-N1)-methyltransferase TrmD [Magnetococcus marinus]A0L4Y8.1 RecName: Full=tRNA (guanine-N(1)-)-methyltransferase; AltName: Full=M1G-methyltransferase; AltName: Full=tRNA [GM37] methyltransferase [Magnetococcus marinus MC-1]ABK43031.1 tRNA (Guanine37-N(1)-) methyltransferase [Magnetococcus marinus MC-1]
MRFSILTLFPEMFAPLQASILGRGQKSGRLDLNLVQIRDFATDRHQNVDDTPFGGGPGMVLKPDILSHALRATLQGETAHVVYMSPQGSRFDQATAQRLAGYGHVVLLCGRYEGVDERFIDAHVDEELSVGDFVLTGGELPAMMVVDAVSRMVPGVLGDLESAQADSFQTGLLDHPHYTRPAHWVVDGDHYGAPEVLLSGNHGAIAEWRRRQALLRTLIRRPDLLGKAPLSRVEKRLIEALAVDLDALENKH